MSQCDVCIWIDFGVNAGHVYGDVDGDGETRAQLYLERERERVS